MKKRLYVMSPEEYALFTECCNPPALLVVHGAMPPSWNRFEKAEAFWIGMGAIHGFDWRTVEPCPDLHVAFYRASEVVPSA